MEDRIIRIAAILSLVAFWFICLDRLSTFPPVGEDEPWIAATPYKLVTEGVYGSDLFAGYYGMERHDFQRPPIYPLLLAGVFKLAGVGVLQMRLLPVICGFLVLVMVWKLGEQLHNRTAGAVGVVLLLSQRLAIGHTETGIPLLDAARISRNDIAVPVFGLLAFWIFNRAEESRRPASYFLAGVLVALAALSHVYGAFWLPALLVVLFWRRGLSIFFEGPVYLLISGFLLTSLPWLAIIGLYWSDVVGQLKPVAARFDLFNPSFYLENVLHEINRYRPLDLFLPSGRPDFIRPGTWFALLGLAVALGIALWRERPLRNSRIFAAATVLVVQFVLFALLLKPKNYSYIIALWPLAILLLAWVWTWLWDRSSSRRARLALALFLGFILLEGGQRIAHRSVAARETTSYSEFASKVAAYIPRGSRVLGLQHYWLGLRQYPYRTWLFPANLAYPGYYHQKFSLDQALELVNPEVVLIDRYMSAYFEAIADPRHPRHSQLAEFNTFMLRRRARLVGIVEDATYGSMRIYHLKEKEADGE